MYLLLIGVIFYSGFIIFRSKREHLLSVLLSLEFMVLGVYLFILTVLGDMDLFYSLIYITFAACEGALGLSILVIMSRTHGGDYFKSFNLFLV